MKKQSITSPVGGVRFPFGHVSITTAAKQSLSPIEVADALFRHAHGDWGTVNKDDWESNELALHEHGRLLSTYLATDQTVFWIITEWDRTSTTILLPSDY